MGRVKIFARLCAGCTLPRLDGMRLRFGDIVWYNVRYHGKRNE